MPAERTLLMDCQGARLLGVLHEPPAGSARRPGVLVIVGGPQYRVGSHRQFVVMARQLAAAGYPVLRFDYRGMGDSEGDVRPFDAVDADIRAVLDAWYAEDASLPGVVLWGLCDGASAAMIYCSQDARVIGVVAVNPWVRTEAAEARSYVKHYYLQRLLQRSFWAKVLTLRFDLGASLADLGRKLAMSSRSRSSAADPRSFIDRMRAGVAEFRGQVLCLLSERDLTAQQFRDRLRTDPGWGHLMQAPHVELHDLEGADHTFSSANAGAMHLDLLTRWLGERTHVTRDPRVAPGGRAHVG